MTGTQYCWSSCFDANNEDSFDGESGLRASTVATRRHLLWIQRLNFLDRRVSSSAEESTEAGQSLNVPAKR
jgi:hypothetical protein